MSDPRLIKEAVLRVGQVLGVSGRKVTVGVDKEKNLSELFFEGEVLKNVAVGSYIEIRKGFLSLIGKVDGEFSADKSDEGLASSNGETIRRSLSVSLVGFIDGQNQFYGGAKELPLVGNECFLLTKEKLDIIHNLTSDDELALKIAKSDYEGYEISLPIDGLINSHVAIFGNTGSGKSNTLAALYKEFCSTMSERNKDEFYEKCKVLIIDFNGEYVNKSCIAEDKKVYKLSTYCDEGDRVPLGQEGAIDIEILSILSDATEKTQKPFLNRALSLMNRVSEAGSPISYIQRILERLVKGALQMSDKIRADLVIDYFRQVLPEKYVGENIEDLSSDLDWNNTNKEFKYGVHYLKSRPHYIPSTIIYRRISDFSLEQDFLSDYITFCYIQLISDILSNRAQNEHIAPVINKLKSKKKSIKRVFDPFSKDEFFQSNIAVVSLNDVNIEMKKTVPLLLCKTIYHQHKLGLLGESLNIVIDEAHNILSRESFREAESWKDYRLETFEEIVKEGRKFGVFVTISSQRPSDISPTITSQAHNYFIHRLINERDLLSIASAVSYIDKVTEESIPALPVGTCVFSGMACQMPLKLSINPLDDQYSPKSTTLKFKDIVAG